MKWENINQPCDIETGLLINFGEAKLHIKKYLMTVR